MQLQVVSRQNWKTEISYNNKVVIATNSGKREAEKENKIAWLAQLFL